MTTAQKWFSTAKVGPYLQKICKRMYGSTRSFKFPADTRFAGKLLQIKQFFNMNLAIQQCVTSERYKRYNFDDDVYAERLENEDVWELMSRIINCAGPLLLLVRLGDLKQATLSKLKGTVDHIKRLMVETGDGSLEDEIANIFHEKVCDLESDVASAAYIIDPQFVHESKDATRAVMDSFWKVSRQILGHMLTDAEWLGIRSTLAGELQAFRMKSAGFAFEDYTLSDTCIFWGIAGCHAPTLKTIAFALAPQPCSSSEAERNWFEVKSNKTKTRNRLRGETLQKMIFVRRFLRLQDKMLTTTIQDAGYKQWVKLLLRDAARSSTGGEEDESHGGNDAEDMESLIIFNDTIEEGEQVKINGKEVGKRIVSLSELHKDKAARSWLFEKYYNMCFVDKNPEEPDPDVPPLADPSRWEHRQIVNVVWARRLGHVVDSQIINDDGRGESETYVIDEVLLKMIRDSPHNTRKIKSKITNNNTVAQPVNRTNDHDSDCESGNDIIGTI